MQILVHSTLFSPSVGGMESVMELLVEEFINLGHSVTLASNVSIDVQKFPRVKWISTSNYLALFLAAYKSDLILQANIGIPASWILLLGGRGKLSVVHHTWYSDSQKKIRIRDRLKLFTTRFVKNISVSSAIASHLPVKSEVIHNPYNDKLFTENPNQKRERDFLFVGRLVSDKGADLLLNAFSRISAEATLTIVGEGPERENLLELSKILGLENRVQFSGKVTGEELAKIYQQHKILVIPSRWEEPFGVVGLEGIASGCRVLASDRVGLREALGSYAVYFEPCELESFVSALNSALESVGTVDVAKREYLEKFKPSKIAARYLTRIPN